MEEHTQVQRQESIAQDTISLQHKQNPAIGILSSRLVDGINEHWPSRGPEEGNKIQGPIKPSQVSNCDIHPKG